jgi:uncharacterized protein with NRDE domain
MCTVSFVPVKDKIFITSNRDEKNWRQPAKSPELYNLKEQDVLSPKDGNAGGSWIALCRNGNVGVLLNGAFEKHVSQKEYLKSRGIVFLEIMDSERPLNRFLKMSLEGIEPFTLILWQKNNLYECRWDANSRKHCQSLPAYRPYIWSSSTLYDSEVRKKRELWFAKWLNKTPTPHQEEVLNFHRFAGDGDEQNDLFMNRDGNVFTVSITGICIDAESGSMVYNDLQSGTITEHTIEFANTMKLVS